MPLTWCQHVRESNKKRPRAVALPRSIWAYSTAIAQETGICDRTVYRWAADRTDSSHATNYACTAATVKLYGLDRETLYRLCPWDLQ